MRPYLTLHDPARARGYYDAGTWRDETFYGLMAGHAAVHAEAIALQDGRRTLTWRELKAWADALAADLRAGRLTTGDRVCLWMSNRIEGVVAFLACSREGFACNPSLHKTYTCAEIITLVTRLKAAALVTEANWGADRDEVDFEAMVAGLPFLRKVYDVDALPEPGTAPATPPEGNPDKVAYLAFTSGTTGAPKCVMHSDNSLLANCRDLVRDWSLNGTDRILTLSPTSHHIAWVAVGQWLLCGGRLITDLPPAGMSRLDWILETGATYVLGVPTHAMDLLAEKRARGIEELGAVRTVYMAGAPIPPTVAEAFVKAGVRPQNVYGMTECSSHQYTVPSDAIETIVGTCGRGGPAYSVRLFDPEDRDKEVAAGQVGEIGGRGAALMLGYLGNQEAVEDSFNSDGWFLSGDLGCFDGHGNLIIRGRLKDLIIRGGHNIYPSRMEALALRHAGVVKVAAVPVPDERLGERACLAVVGVAGAEEILAHLRAEGLSKYDMPEYFLKLDAFPLTPSGKILKRELVEMIKRGDVTPEPIRSQAK